MEDKVRVSIYDYVEGMDKKYIILKAHGVDCPVIKAKTYISNYFNSLARIWGAEVRITNSATDTIGEFRFKSIEHEQQFWLFVLSVRGLVISNS